VTATFKNNGFHPVLERDHGYIFIDSCMQAWPDADYECAHRHGVTAYAVTAMDPHADAELALKELMFWHLIARSYPNLNVATTSEDIRSAKAEGKAIFILAAQGGDFIGDQLHRVEAFQRLGLRMMLLAYNTSNNLCDGLLDRTERGLTSFGQLVVDECNRVGILLDLTHTGKRSCLEIIERSTYPCTYSHSNAAALVPNPRNVDDEQLRACLARDGVIGLAPWGPLTMKPGTTHWPTVDDFIDQIDHVCALAGNTDQIGFGTDMSLGTYPEHHADPWGMAEFPDIATDYNKHVTADQRSPMRNLNGFQNYSEIVNMIERLLARGYSDDDVRGFLGENYLRLFKQVWGA